MHSLAAHVLIGLALALAAPAAVLAQDPDPLAAAVTAFAEVKELDEKARAPAVAELGRFDGEGITALLLGELQRAQSLAYQVQVVEAIGMRRRPGVLEPLAEKLAEGGRSVQRAGAEAIARQGNVGIDYLTGIVEDPPGGRTARGRDIRMACLYGMSRVDEDRAWRVIAEQVLQGRIDERLQVLTLLEDAGNNASVRRAREACLRDDDLRIASGALRQLVDAGYSRSESAILTLLERTVRPTDEVRAAMIHSIAKTATRDLFEPLIQQASSEGRLVHEAIADVAPDVAANRNLVTWLVEEGLERRLPAERDAAVRLLSAVDRDQLSSVLQPLLRRLRRPREDYVTTIVALHPLLREDPSWEPVLLGVAGSSKPELRTVGLDLLAEAGNPAGLAVAHRSFSDREWQVRAAAYDYCGAVRDVSSIPLLIRRLERESFRLREDVLDALEALTGRRFQYPEGWNDWWRENKAGFQLPPLKDKRGAPTGSGSTFSYYQIPLVSNRVTFVLDVSGSMNERIGTSRQMTRLVEAKRQLERVIGAMPEDYGFNIIYYSDRVRPFFEGLRDASENIKQRATDGVKLLRARGGTNIYDALELAFADSDVDTIYLLSDGQPTDGRIVEPIELAEEVIQWNRTRRIRIHGISVGEDSELLKRLADESGGAYVFVR